MLTVCKGTLVRMKCWYCCGSIDEPTRIGLPTNFHAHTGKFTLHGHFCSWPCVKSYNRDSHFPSRAYYYSLLRMLFASVGNESDAPIPSLPPRDRLDEFGGDMTREVFHETAKSHTKDVLYVPDYLVDIRPPIQTSSSNAQGFRFGPMKIPEKEGVSNRFPKVTTASPEKRGKGKKDVVSMLTAFGKS